ncbi:hypothetical protein GUJ93_ZPchr0012g18918 [Zizania palustris]|uniref:Uncharacterized protein n=1 Tax=Zizania palustris TaxID=103762 RepID=A0A8J5WWN7_ZIZPA|nr:hypothetical protein GUJ93_ZPchr0012g18918 [Zizania palustris]
MTMQADDATSGDSGSTGDSARGDQTPVGRRSDGETTCINGPVRRCCMRPAQRTPRRLAVQRLLLDWTLMLHAFALHGQAGDGAVADDSEH